MVNQSWKEKIFNQVSFQIRIQYYITFTKDVDKLTWWKFSSKLHILRKFMFNYEPTHLKLSSEQLLLYQQTWQISIAWLSSMSSVSSMSYMLQNKQRLSMFLKLGFKQTYRNNTNISCNTDFVCATPATHIYLQRKVNNVCFSNLATLPSSLQVISFVLLCPHIKAFQVISSMPHLKASVPESFHVCACPVPCVCPSKWSQCSLLCTMITSQSFCSKSFHLCVSPSKWSQCSLLCTLFQHLKASVPNSFHLCVCPASAVWATWQQPFKWQSIKWTWDGTK